MRLLRYAMNGSPPVFHVLWNNKLEYIDRTFLMAFYRLLGKRVVLTAHNVNARRRDGCDSALNRLTLRIQYRFAERIFVHTERMKAELNEQFGVHASKCTVIPFGLNSTVPDSAMTSPEARSKMGISGKNQVLLFFGNIAPYKGLEFLVEALAQVVPEIPDCRLIVAGRPKGNALYWAAIKQIIKERRLEPYIHERIEFVPDEDTEIYFKAADVLVLPYTEIFQSGVLSLGYNFGLPVIAADVGSLRDDIVAGETGFVFKPRDVSDLANTILTYFSGPLFLNLSEKRNTIKAFARQRFSWDEVGRITKAVYASLVVRD